MAECHADRVDGPAAADGSPPTHGEREPRARVDGTRHGVSVFLFADIRGYTDFTSLQGADAASQLVARFTGTVSEVVDHCGGSVRGTWGDEVFAVFDSARDAVRAAVAMQERFVAAALADEDVPLVVGVGLDAGEAVVSAGADSGSAVNVAARLCSRAGPGETLATRELVHLAGAVPGARYEENGRARLKGVPGRTALVRIRPTSTGKAQLAAFRLAVARLPGRKRARRRRWAWVAGLTAAGLVVGAATWSVARWRTVEPPTIAADSVGVIDADSGRLEATVTLPTGQHADAVVIGSTAAWLVDSAAGTVFRVDLATRRIVLPIPVGDTPVAAAELDGYLWVVNEGAATLSRINERTNQVVRTVSVGTKPTAIVAAFRRLWVTDQADNVVIRVDPDGREPNKRIGGVGDAPAGIAADDSMLWVANSADGTITTIDPTTLEAGPPIHVGAGPRSVLASRGSVFVANELELSVSQVDPARRRETSRTPVGDAPSTLAAADGAVWVTDTGASTLTRIDPGGARGTVTWSLGSSPLSVAADGPRLWVSTQPGPSPAHRGGTLTVAVSDDWFDNLDPQRTYVPEAWAALSMVYDGLVGLRRTTGSAAYELVPDLAEKLPTPTANQDGTSSYTFTLRPGISYSDGRSVEPGDVRRGLEREFTATTDPAASGNPSYYRNIVGGEACYRRPSKCSLDQGIKTNDGANTVTITLSQPDPDFLYKLTLPFATVVPPGSPMTGANPPAFPGTGPYKIARFADPVGCCESDSAHGRTTRQTLTLVRNTHFHQWSSMAQPAGYPDVIRWEPKSPANAEKDVLAGTADVTTVRPTDEQSLRDAYPDRIKSQPWGYTFMVVLNTNVAPFNNVEARKAFARTLDRGALAAALHGPAETCDLVPPGLPGHIATTCPDPRTYAQQAHTSKGDVVVYLWRGWSGTRPVLAKALTTLGYTPVIKWAKDLLPYVSAPPPAALKVNVSIAGWSADYPSASQYYAPILQCHTGGNIGRHCNVDLDGKASAAALMQLADPGQAQQMWRKIYSAVADQVPVVPFAHETVTFLVSERANPHFLQSWALGPLYDQAWVR